VSECFGIGKVVDGDELDLGIVEGGSDDIAAYAAEAVDAYFYGHSTSVLLRETALYLGLSIRIAEGGEPAASEGAYRLW